MDKEYENAENEVRYTQGTISLSQFPPTHSKR